MISWGYGCVLNVIILVTIHLFDHLKSVAAICFFKIHLFLSTNRTVPKLQLRFSLVTVGHFGKRP